MTEYPNTPTLDRIAEIAPLTQAAGEFIDWLRENKGVNLMVWQELEDGEHLLPLHQSIPQLLAEWKGIDVDEADKERRAILEYLHSQA